MWNVLLILTLTSQLAFSKPLPRIIASKIKSNKPSISSNEAKYLAATIYEASIVHKIDPMLYTAILRQESNYNVNAVSYKVKFDRKSGKLNKVAQDHGISQINYKTIKAYGFDKKRLESDVAYSVEAGAIVLSDFQKRYSKLDNFFWSRYNSSNVEARWDYFVAVTRYM